MIKNIILTASIALFSLNATAACKQLNIFNKTDTVATYNITVAKTPEMRARGLMFIKNMPLDTGMLFVWPSYKEITMWMKNTFMPLDMIFIKDLEIVGIIENAVPQSLDILTIGKPSDKVLELNSGQVKLK
ncbi:MAG TPA: DUF192 domain-containing protein, partial [Alphaproteobacteria bacterium]|nr:DUF192 domain-containing protein [Alphaproteobacteria bacterium]